MWEAWRTSGFYPRHRDPCWGTDGMATLDFESPDFRRERIASMLDLLDMGYTLVLCGERGTGKTQLAAWLALQWMFSHSHTDRCEGVAAPRYLRLYDLFRAMKDRFDNKAKADPMHRARAAQLLILDEIQERHDTVWEDRELTSLMDERYGFKRPSILITNLKPAAIGEALGPSILDRIREDGGVYEIRGKQWRAAKAKGGAA